MAREIIWSDKVRQNIRDIHDYWLDRTGSDSYPIKLEESFFSAVDSLEHSPFQGKATITTPNIRYLIVGYHKIFYALSDHEIIILSVFDTRQDPEKTPY